MAQQNPIANEDMVYKKMLFYDNGIRFIQVRAKLVTEYKPPAPVMKSNVNQTIKSSAGLVQNGTSHYISTISLLFYSKKEYADWLQYIGSQHKYYDEKGTIYVGIVEGQPNVQTVEQESKYLVTVNLLLIRKQEFEYRHVAGFIDVEGHWAEQYIDEMQKKGLIAVYGQDGEPVQYFRPDDYLTRAEAMSLFMRTYRHMERLLRGY